MVPPKKHRLASLPPFTGLSLLLLLLLALAPAARAQSGPLAQSGQALLVLADGWDSREGEMRLYERLSDGAWKQDGPAIPVVLGKNGLAWGIGLHESAPAKREGDGRAPAGIFRLGFVFGYAPSGPRGLKMPYKQMTDGFECVDDAASPRYNQVLDATGTARGWSSSEKMLRPDPLYELGVTVQHNPAPSSPGAGSCIFLHVWRGPESFTAGCTAMSRADMVRLVTWLDPARNPVLVQLPKSEHDAFVRLYGAP